MKLVLDTHFLIWMANTPGEISAAEQRAINGARSRHVSAASLWELRIKWRLRDRKGRRKGTLDPAQALVFIDTNSIDLISLEATDSMFTLEPPIDHRDPFDEMLLVHAQRLGARLLTRDRLLRDHPLALSV
jgi:PIN domain nuclease of toxin-antitoxin system